MPRSKDMEEALHTLFGMEERISEPVPVEQLLEAAKTTREAVDEAIDLGLISEVGSGVRLTEVGRQEGSVLVRRHRLAERMLHDVLHVADETTESTACEFEHFLAAEVTESICTLLGHPQVCPHGKPIPPGECCDRRQRDVVPVVERLSRLTTGDTGSVAYVHTHVPGRLDRLASFGLVPGTAIRVHQTWPSMVVSLGETEISFDVETAEDIFVRRDSSEADCPQGWGMGWGRGGRGRGRRHRGGR